MGYGCKPSQDRLRPTEEVGWVRSKKRGEGGMFALEKDFDHNALRCKPIRLGINESDQTLKPNETKQNKITKIVFTPGKETKTKENIGREEKIQESNKHCNDNWITKCLEMENVENSKKEKNEEETKNENNSKKIKEETKFAERDIESIPLETGPGNSY